MIQFTGRGILLDIEGTTSSISYVYDVLFPYARKNLVPFLQGYWEETEVRHALETIASEQGAVSFAEWTRDRKSKEESIELVVAVITGLMDRDTKVTGLKELQGLIWRQGYNSGQLQSHVFADVPLAMDSWSQAGIDLRIYSSGSVEAQKVFFAHTDAGDLSKYFRGHYDTTVGAKRDPASYVAIASTMQCDPADILFLSDVPAELDAAQTAGMQTALVVRPGNKDVVGSSHRTVSGFDQIAVSLRPAAIERSSR